KREGAVGPQGDELRHRQAGAGAIEGDRGHVGHRQLRRAELGAETAVAAAEVERPVGGLELAHELEQMPRGGAAIDGHELPELIVVATHRGPAATRLFVRGPKRSRTMSASGKSRRSSAASISRIRSWSPADAPITASRLCTAAGRNW